MIQIPEQGNCKIHFLLYCIVPFGKQEWQSDYGTWGAVTPKNIKPKQFLLTLLWNGQDKPNRNGSNLACRLSKCFLHPP